MSAEWPEVAAQFGEENIGIVDQAIGKCFDAYPDGIPRADFYLVSEGLTHAVFMALRDNGIRLTPAVTPMKRANA